MDTETPQLIEAPDRLPEGGPQTDGMAVGPLEDATAADAAEAAPEPLEGVRNPRRVRVREADLQIDAEFQAILPPPSDEQVEALRASLREHKGCTSFLLVWAGKNVLLDGHTRLRLCREMTAENEKGDLWLWLGDIELPDRAAALDWIRKHQLARRELGPLVASCIRGEAYNARKGTRGGDRTSGRANRQGGGLPDAAQQVAAEFGVSDRTIERDGRLAEVVAKIAANCGPQARPALLAPKHRLTRHGIDRLKDMGPEEQREAVAYLVENGKLPPEENEGARKVVLPRKKEDLVQALARLPEVLESEDFLALLTAALQEARTRTAAGDGRRRRSRKRAGRKVA
jgi:hypothetical protein